MACVLVSIKHLFYWGEIRNDPSQSRHPLCLASMPKNASAMRRMNRPYLYVGFDDDTTMSR